jgi:hypothetical protein
MDSSVDSSGGSSSNIASDSCCGNGLVVVRALVAIVAWILPELFSSFVPTTGEGKHDLCYVCLV